MDLFAYPVSLVMKFWHWALSFVVDPDSGVAWVGSVLLLVVTVRLLLLRSMWRQQYSMRKMAQLAPKMKELQNKYKDRKSPEDRQEQAKEMQALYADAGVNPLAGCLPLLVQIPVFLGLYYVLLNFSPPGKSIEEASQMTNGAFGPEQVSSFLNAEIFGVPLASYIRMPQEVMDSLHPGLVREDILMLAVPLFVLAGIATFINMWNSFRRQKAAKAAEQAALARVDAEERAGGPVVDGEVLEVDGEKPAAPTPATTGAGGAAAGAGPDGKPQDFQSMAEQMTESMNQSMKIMMYLFPFFPIVGAYFFNFPIAIGLYWLTNNIWTAVQSHIFMEKLEKELPMSSREGLPPSAFM
ncbi:preprotein translocase YidC [Dietzia sp. HMSC21D01]|uniref:Membrane protein insertase YidC n=1 Tax=Dietzia cinnamea TaxID=321318 RepID=A0AAW5Q256_9ACTN|nr:MULTISPECIES: membrane protein insertase YidC [Dietzia]MCT1862733.1 membrane protein insertase YidC [Dietzia cinnamea]MCT1884310.1 membrane protein insertase YidC [Dietzia cinnamea]MCT2029757.1 membrane protein insertase YidC [Dietzia cinnamea]MCT2032010.1 membrane protein insertase YidC [Dietzia cinnamea]MCT2057258.1 membrane protein insertase YidC [Dietzia cinnamea]